MYGSNTLDTFFRYRLNVSLLVTTICLVELGLPLSWETFGISLSFTALWSFIYLYNKVTDISEDSHNIKGQPIDQKALKKTWIASYVCLLIPLPYLLQWPSLIVLYTVLALILGYGYSKKFIIGKYVVRLKNIIFIKNFTSGLCWGAFATLVPMLYHQHTFGEYELIKWANYTVMIFIIEAIWDIRDIEGDKKENIRTLPNTWGIRPTKILCLTLAICLLIWRLSIGEISNIYIGAYITTIVSIALTHKNSHAYIFQNLVMIWTVANILFLMKFYL